MTLERYLEKNPDQFIYLSTNGDDYIAIDYGRNIAKRLDEITDWQHDYLIRLKDKAMARNNANTKRLKAIDKELAKNPDNVELQAEKDTINIHGDYWAARDINARCFLRNYKHLKDRKVIEKFEKLWQIPRGTIVVIVGYEYGLFKSYEQYIDWCEEQDKLKYTE